MRSQFGKFVFKGGEPHQPKEAEGRDVSEQVLFWNAPLRPSAGEQTLPHAPIPSSAGPGVNRMWGSGVKDSREAPSVYRLLSLMMF